MPKAFSIAGLVVAVLLILLFGLDLGTGIPFHKFSMSMDIGLLVCSAMLAYMSWRTYRELP
jgi:hypothetical protein